MQKISFSSKGEKKDNKVSILLFFYLLSILLLFIVENNSFRKIPYQLLSTICVIVFFLYRMQRRNFKVRIEIAIYVALCVVTGVMNFLIIKNSSLINVIECSIFNTVIAGMLIEMKINTRWLKYACYAFSVIFLYRIARMGLFVRITRFSNNQVSVALLIPVVIYYTITDIRDEQVSIIPATLAMLLSLVSRGRSGIIASLILFVAVFLKYFNIVSLAKEKSQRKKFRRALFGLIVSIVLVTSAYILITRYADQIFSKFYSRGLDNTSRQVIWKEYIDYATNSIKYFFLGVPKQNLMIGQYFGGNTHNSFISIHANNGIVMFIFCVALILKAIRYAIKHKYYIYLTCIVVFCLRSFFDNMFWGTWGTTAFVVLLFIPLLRTVKNNGEVLI